MKRIARLLNLLLHIKQEWTPKILKRLKNTRYLKKLWNSYDVELIPVVVGSLGTLPRKLKECLDRIGIETKSGHHVDTMP